MDLETLTDVVIVAGYAIFLVLAVVLLIKARVKDLQFIRARVFLKKDFLINNLVLITAAGTLLAVHEFVKIGFIYGIVSNEFSTFGELLETFSLLFLIFWMYSWREMLS